MKEPSSAQTDRPAIKESIEQSEDLRLPVTLLSGFLGAGKTTLLEHVLNSKDHGLKCGVIVNDMSSLNIDAQTVANHKLTQADEKLVQMQNGCICCTLREDLLEEVANIAAAGDLDYLLIESTGISEPMQVAETFTYEFAEHAAEGEDAPQGKMAEILKAGGLPKIARLDTCVTVVDAVNVLNDFQTTDFITDRPKEAANGEVDPQDERNVTDLLVDQLEFADVILVNKIDIADKQTVGKVLRLIETLNPRAKVIPTVKCRVDLNDILNTKRFSFEEAVTGAGWLQSLQESIPRVTANGSTKNIPKPETEEYGISNFVYRRRRPFHPERLWKIIGDKFVVIQNEYEAVNEDDSEGTEGEEMAGSEDTKMDDDIGEAQPQLDPAARLAAKRADPALAPVMRSKGFCWLATRNTLFGEWSQAGVMFTLSGGQNWFVSQPEEMWADGNLEAVKAIREDFVGDWGDRRQEIVFIGGGEARMNQTKIEALLDSALLSDKEWGKWEKVMKSKKLSEDEKEDKLLDLFKDGFEDWIDPLNSPEGFSTQDMRDHPGHTHGPDGHHSHRH